MKEGGVCIINFPRHESNYYIETDFVHKFSLAEVEVYGRMFADYHVVQGNLPNYEKEFDRNINHEYFLIGIK